MFFTGKELETKIEAYREQLLSLFQSAIVEKKPLDALKKIYQAFQCNKIELQKVVESLFYDATRQYAIMQYINMENNNDYGEMGEQRVSISFCRCILNIPNDREVTQFDADRFRRLIDEYKEKFGKTNLANRVKNPEFDILGMKISIAEWRNMNNILAVVGSNKELLFTYHKSTPTIFFMECEKRKIGNMDFYLIKKEHVRTPNQVLSIAATQGEKSTRIRYESCEVIFFNKWQSFYNQSKAERRKALQHPNSAVREGIKEKALALYGIKSSEDALKAKDMFIEEMVDGILWHEIGHRLSEQAEGSDRQLDALLTAVGRGDYYTKALNEAMADWAPRRGEEQGAISRFCEIAKTDRQKALRLSYVYLSDNWFVDEEEEFMAFYTDILTSLFLGYFNAQGDINFEQIEKDIPKIHAFLMRQYYSAGQKLMDLLKKYSYKVGIQVLDFDSLVRETLRLYKGTKMDKPKEELMQTSHFWVNILAYANNFSTEFAKEYKDFFIREGRQVCLDLLKVLSRNNVEKYNYSIREYILQKYKEIGVLQEPKKVDYKAVLQSVTQSLKMPEKIAAKVYEQFEKIIQGENFDISINYEGERDPFIAVLQELMLKTGYGDIKAGMLVGEMFDPKETAEKRKEYIRDELENIRDQIEAEMYMEIDQLKVNQKYNIKPMVEELLEAITFFDGKTLGSKIKEVSYEELKTDALFEVFIPLKRGYMDWNTSQAVWRINQDLRPDEFIMQWTIDKEFLDALLEAYVS